MNGKQQGQGGDGLFSARQIIHGCEALPGGHAAVVDATKEGLIWIVCTQNGLERRCLNYWIICTIQMLQAGWSKTVKNHLSTAVPAQPFIDLIDYHRNVLEALAEAVKALGFHVLKLLIALPHHFGAGIKS